MAYISFLNMKVMVGTHNDEYTNDIKIAISNRDEVWASLLALSKTFEEIVRDTGIKGKELDTVNQLVDEGYTKFMQHGNDYFNMFDPDVYKHGEEK